MLAKLINAEKMEPSEAVNINAIGRQEIESMEPQESRKLLETLREMIRSIYLKHDPGTLGHFDRLYPDSNALRRHFEPPMEGKFYVAQSAADQSVIGFLEADRSNGAEAQFFGRDRALHISWLRINEAFRGKGITTRLFERFLADVQEEARIREPKKGVLVTVNMHYLNDLEKLKEMWRRYGFETIGDMDALIRFIPHYENLSLMRRVVKATVDSPPAP